MNTYKGVICFFVGHQIARGERWTNEPDFCWRCGTDWPQDKTTIHKYLNHAYCWMVDREWRWFDSLDEWLCSRYRGKLPKWWEY